MVKSEVEAEMHSEEGHQRIIEMLPGIWGAPPDIYLTYICLGELRLPQTAPGLRPAVLLHIFAIVC